VLTKGILEISKIIRAATMRFLFLSPWFKAAAINTIVAPTGLRGNERTLHAVLTNVSFGKKNASTMMANSRKPPSKVRYALGITFSSKL
jgi:hypothetical protein